MQATGTLTPFDPEVQPGERPFTADATMQGRCAQNIPERVFEAARVCAFAFPTASPDQWISPKQSDSIPPCGAGE